MFNSVADAPTATVTAEDRVPGFFAELADSVLAGTPLSRDDALAILRCDESEVMDLVAAAARLRRRYFGNTIKANYLVNLKSGLCPEDCSYCSQRLGSEADIVKYSWLKPEEAVTQARHGIHAGASRVCLVSSGRGPSHRDVDRVSTIVGALKDDNPELEVCACLGLLKEGQAEKLAEAGVDAYNHNVNTAESKYQQICSTHTYADRVDTVTKAKDAGLSPCSGLIVGMGESAEEIVDAIFALRDIGADSIPVNFYMPFEGTPLDGTWELTPVYCLRVLALARFTAPAIELRIAGGREMHLRSLQPLALHIANSIFLGDYLTSEGQATKADLDMIADAGFVILGHHNGAPAAAGCASYAHEVASGCSGTGECGGDGGCGGHAAAAETVADHQAQREAETVGAGVGAGAGHHAPIRRRGAGTDVAPNA